MNLSAIKFQKLTQSLKQYKKIFLDKPLGELDESGTRLLINHLLTEILGYETLVEVKTEYMIKGTYADYVIQINGKRHFLVEVKALSLNLSEKHLRQTVNYGANEGIDWVVLTNGRCLQLYRVLFEKPISSELIFEIDFSNTEKIKQNADKIQYLHKDLIQKNSLDEMWAEYSILIPKNLAKFIYSEEVLKFLQKEIKKNYGTKLEIEKIEEAVINIARSNVEIDDIKEITKRKKKKLKDSVDISNSETTENNEEVNI